MGARRVLVRERDGGLTDVAGRRPVTDSEVLDDLRAGRPFRAHRRDTGADCTIEVLARVMGVPLGPGGRRDGPDGRSSLAQFAEGLIGSRRPGCDPR
ncbi:hypothetical protein LZG04_26700 [Saccharothrix sp. S26]|uniref:hypothetical protein n=1 Tax=Saccharothrix sp. S26 TaxID=2907215 RepID=UPI001F23ED93|nr:hypothetical protein [Saccharothrix sp. S26]MCE6998361.1 hypothetical protein [Saccharothrix sp. S26]